MIIELRDDLKVDEYNKLRKSIGWDVKEANLVEDAIQRSTIVKKAMIHNEVVGMARVIGDGIYYLIVDVVVRLEYQKNGIGKKIIDAITSEVESRTKEGQTSSINLVSMNGKEAFYEKCGFEKIPMGYTGYGMIKRIKKV
ncbi:GNAT family N-acetyltransferase [Anaerosporobacter sp.]|uniref:GNAT family N-acetyltransferase n=1 Tax=Anaerosporobacter sp. TaxID=1872529 RepID=UPI00286F1342|nr:GNAT family N-acetyltransferase [Anaerosporobacter sp.]